MLPALQTILCCLSLLLLPLVQGYKPLSDQTLQSLPAAGADFDIKSGKILAPILIPRVPGTPGSLAVRQHLVSWFQTNLPKWTITFQNSTATTPATGTKQVPFINIIITRDPPWTSVGDVGRLAVVAHYDSKLEPAGFIGATDSAAPVAMIMHAARSVDEALTSKWEAMKKDGSSGLEEEKGVQLLFLDGEEAFVSWTATDSLYGARYVFLRNCASCEIELIWMYAGLWQRNGKDNHMKLYRPILTPSPPYPYFSSSTCSAQRIPGYRHTSRRHTGHTRDSQVSRRGWANWGY